MEVLGVKKPYEKPEIEITEFELEEICYSCSPGGTSGTTDADAMMYGFDAFFD